VRHVEAVLRMPSPPDDDPAGRASSAAGATMDLGCYSLSCLRLLGSYAGGEPRVVGARADVRAGRPGVDERLFVDLEFPRVQPGSVAATWTRPTVTWPWPSPVMPARSSSRCFPVPHEGDALVLRRRGEPEVVDAAYAAAGLR